jgi:hypothetical protein
MDKSTSLKLLLLISLNFLGLLIILTVAFLALTTFHPVEELVPQESATFVVKDAITGAPVPGATVMLRKIIYCIQVVGENCPVLVFTQSSNAKGQVFFHEDLTDIPSDTHFMIQVHTFGYEVYEDEYIYQAPPRSVTIDLLPNGSLTIKNSAEAISFANELPVVMTWARAHPDEMSPYVTFESPHWLVEYQSVTNCGQSDPYASRCGLRVTIDGELGKLLQIEPTSK